MSMFVNLNDVCFQLKYVEIIVIVCWKLTILLFFSYVAWIHLFKYEFNWMYVRDVDKQIRNFGENSMLTIVKLFIWSLSL